jgi:O-methyltransferase
MNNRFLNVLRRIADLRAVNRLLEGVDLHSDNRMRERGMLAQAFEFKKINNVPGDYFEFGLWRGKTFLYAYEMKRRYRCEDMRLWGFDSFQGLPAVDDPRDNIWRVGQFSCSEPEFRDILRRAGIPQRDYELISGYYENSLNSQTRDRLVGRSAAIVYIDCDLYSSTKQVLDFVKPFFVDGTIVCFDDYYNYKASPKQGEQRALAEFLDEQEGLKFISWFDYSPLGKSFIVRLSELRSGS